ncbi:MAG: sensor domain-containing diguanylate cyclase [Terriglobales bacterium]
MSDLDRSLRSVALLHESSQLILSGGDLDSVLHQILLIVRNYFAATNCAVFLTDESATELVVKARNGYPEQRWRYRIGIDGIVGWAAKAKQAVSVPDVRQESRYLQGDPSVQSELALPLMVRGELLGVLDVESDQLNFFTPDVVQLLSMFAGQAGIAIDNTRLYENERRRMRQIELINLIARSASSTPRTRDLLLTLCELISDTFENADTAIFLVQADGTLSLQSRVGNRKPERQIFSPAQRMALFSESVPRIHNPALNTIDRWPGCYGSSTREITVPLVSCGQMLGVIVIAPLQEMEITEEDLYIAQATSDVCATAIKNVQLTEELNRVANTDMLTGVHNQRYFSAAVEFELTRARRYRKPLVLALMELPNVRVINETAGFEAGDDYLRNLARNIQTRIRTNDIVCRFAMDRFAFVFPETDPHQFGAIEKKLRAALEAVTYKVGEAEKTVDAIITSALFPSEGTTSAELLRLLVTRTQNDRQRAASTAV